MDPVTTTPSSSPHHTAKLRELSLHQPTPALAMRPDHGQSQHDEGYSEYPEGSTHSESPDMDLLSEFNDGDEMKKVLVGLPLAKRKEIVQFLIPTLPNACKEDMRAYIKQLTHFDPSVYLPNEINLLIFSYLSPRDLLEAGKVSRGWRTHSQDERLWRLAFAREGWLLDSKRIEAYETFTDKRGDCTAEEITQQANKANVGSEGGMRLERRESRKRGRDEAFKEDGETRTDRFEDLPSDDASAEEPRANIVDQEEMEGVESTSALTAISTDSDDLKLAPAMFQAPTTSAHRPKLSWPCLYKQRRRLESNWENGVYKMFQLPHPDHPHEGHTECVYTIQHTPRHLVSGSRDKTIRIWDLETHRLIRKPLSGHEASVLCLQFDERPEHDIIVSGGSDALIIVWRFSTGEIIKRLAPAHNESVLNLRFDDRYIVTCSKDKTIKVWTRHALEHDSPLIPQHVIQGQSLQRELGSGNLIPEYTLLTTLLGHAAAVNAVMIHENTIVSASGDRTIKAWDLNTGRLKKSYVGHQKGIACVQFDGRRIVSGSSDNTVRIFDAERQAEIACLTGHINLVRTVQARFGDLDIVSDEELAAQARKADLGFYAALARGMQPANVSRRHGSVRNAGSSRPEDMLALGAKVPPGGGGSRWAKIVSGSYDESVILWKRDSEGKWYPRLRLQQDALIRPLTARRPGGGMLPPPPASIDAPVGTLAQAQAHHLLATAQGHLVQANHLLQGQQQQSLPTGQIAVMASNVQNQLNQQLMQQAQGAAPQAAPSQNTNAATVTSPAHNPPQAISSQAVITTTTTIDAPDSADQEDQQQQPPPPQQQQQPNVAPAAGAAAAPHGHHRENRDSNRVFKLQFDTRRIICCSQNKVIVGWDFANGDPELERIGEWSMETA